MFPRIVAFLALVVFGGLTFWFLTDSVEFLRFPMIVAFPVTIVFCFAEAVPEFPPPHFVEVANASLINIGLHHPFKILSYINSMVSWGRQIPVAYVLPNYIINYLS